MNADVYEIFNSVQGEGTSVGARQVFVRFCGCQLHCEYCDTEAARVPTKRCRILDRYINNPLSVGAVIDTIDDLWTPATRSISLTGGEPLLHCDFIEELAKGVSRPIYLETNAGLPDSARSIADHIDVAACDIKLLEHRATRDYDSLLDAELQSIEIFHTSGVETFAKIIVLPETTEKSIGGAIFGIKSIDDLIPLVMQPVTPLSVDICQLLDLMDFAGTHLADVRMIPQLHRMMGIP